MFLLSKTIVAVRGTYVNVHGKSWTGVATPSSAPDAARTVPLIPGGRKSSSLPESCSIIPRYSR